MIPSTAKPGLKICGLTTPQDVEMLVELGVDALGANFYRQSKRYISDTVAADILENAGHIEKVGVFVNEAPDEILRRLDAGWIDIAQLHGEETAAEVAEIKRRGFRVIKALAARDDVLARALDYGADAILIDTPAGADYGGTGKTFDWSIAARFVEEHPDLPVLLAGGITPGNAAAAMEAVRPAMLDVASGGEISPGLKDKNKVVALLEAVRSTSEVS